MLCDIGLGSFIGCMGLKGNVGRSSKDYFPIRFSRALSVVVQVLYVLLYPFSSVIALSSDEQISLWVM